MKRGAWLEISSSRTLLCMKSTWDACFKKKKSEFSRLHSLEIVVHTIRAKYMDVEKKNLRVRLRRKWNFVLYLEKDCQN